MAVAALSVAGCATDEEFRRERAAYLRQAQAQQQAMAHPRVREPEMEEDGLPSQVPPPANRRRDPDDPSEPFSPNYGKPNYGKPNYGNPNYGNPSPGNPSVRPQRTTIAPTPDDAPAPQLQVASFRGL